jgi:hypothetical protein
MKLENKMKTVFKTTLLAAALAASFGSQAATVSSTEVELSAEGVAAGVVATGQNLSIDVVVDETHPSASVITLTFDDKVDLTGLTTTGTVDNTATSGLGNGGDVDFNYGTGSFTFDNVVIDTTTDPDAQTISFQVNLGNALTADSAFRVIIGGSTVDISGASTLSYSSVDAADAAIESGSDTIAVEKTQFSYEVTTSFDGVIERLNRKLFTETADDVDVATVTFTNDEGLLASLGTITAVASMTGTFTGLASGDLVVTTAAGTATLNGDKDEFTNAITALEISDAGADNVYTFTFDETGTADIPVSGDIEIALVVSTPDSTLDYTFSGNAGEWVVDGSTVNVPYLPVGYGLSPNIEIANEGADASISISGFDQNGIEYGPVELSKMAAANAVTKISEADLQAAFGLATTGKHKLSVTFVLDADAADITLAPYYKEGISRVNVMSDQYKGK